MLYCNIIPTYLPVLQKCVSEKLWIRQNRIYYGPYDWAYNFGTAWSLEDLSERVADPYVLLEQGRKILEANPDSERLRLRYDHFHTRVTEYYRSDKDARLLESIRTGRWVK